MPDLKSYLQSLLQHIEDGVAITKEHIEQAIQHAEVVAEQDLGIAGVPIEASPSTAADPAAIGIVGIQGVAIDPAAIDAAQG
jgi:hypothetical protein